MRKGCHEEGLTRQFAGSGGKIISGDLLMSFFLNNKAKNKWTVLQSIENTSKYLNALHSPLISQIAGLVSLGPRASCPPPSRQPCYEAHVCLMHTIEKCSLFLLKCHLVIFALQHLVYQIFQFDFCFTCSLDNSLYNESS